MSHLFCNIINSYNTLRKFNFDSSYTLNNHLLDIFQLKKYISVSMESQKFRHCSALRSGDTLNNDRIESWSYC